MEAGGNFHENKTVLDWAFLASLVYRNRTLEVLCKGCQVYSRTPDRDLQGKKSSLYHYFYLLGWYNSSLLIYSCVFTYLLETPKHDEVSTVFLTGNFFFFALSDADKLLIL